MNFELGEGWLTFTHILCILIQFCWSTVLYLVLITFYLLSASVRHESIWWGRVDKCTVNTWFWIADVFLVRDWFTIQPIVCSSLQDSLNSEKEKSVLIRMAVILVAIRIMVVFIWSRWIWFCSLLTKMFCFCLSPPPPQKKKCPPLNLSWVLCACGAWKQDCWWFRTLVYL